MDVRCEKCQTEYELDEARLKPGGVTVKCTHCGHMFKIRKRAITNVGAPPAGQQRPRTGSPQPTATPTSASSGASAPPSSSAATVSASAPTRVPQRTPPMPGPGPRADSIFDEAPTRALSTDELPTTVERQWLIRLENGDQKSCRELATLQQWIVAGVVTRESLISRTGKTWKRLGDISELAQYFDIADEARTTRGERRAAPTPSAALRPPGASKPIAGTMLGVGQGPVAKAAGGTILPDDEEDTRRAARPVTPPPPVPPKVPLGAKTPPMGSVVAPPPPASPPTGTAPRRPITTPPPPPPKREPQRNHAATPSVGLSRGPTLPASAATGDARSTAAWASDPLAKERAHDDGAAVSGPFVGKLAVIPDEPAFAGRARLGEEAGIETGKVRLVDDDDDDLLPGGRRGSRAGLIIAVGVLVLVGGGVGIYMLTRSKEPEVAKAPADAGIVVAALPDAAVVIPPAIDAAPEPPPLSPLDAALAELTTDNEAQLRKAIEAVAALPSKDEPAAQAVRANLAAGLAQALLDRAGLVTDKAETDKLRKEAKALALDAATSAQRALKAEPDNAAANIAMASVMRLQGKPARDVRRYLDGAKPKAGKEWTRDLALHEGLLLARDGKLDDAKAAFAAIDQGDGKLETSNDVRARFHLALVALAQNNVAEAKPLVEQVLVAQPEHAGALALRAKLETTVAKTDPLPAEDPKTNERPPRGSGAPPPPPPTGGTYDQVLARANQLAETNCGRAMELYAKALELKPNGVEALSGMGYCHIDAKQFASAFGKFRAALAVSPRYEPALWGIGEAYQQQGRKEQAIEAYKAYLDAYPGSAKALRQLDRLGAGDPGNSGGGNGSGAAPTTPPPAGSASPPPAPPPPAGAGSGSA